MNSCAAADVLNRRAFWTTQPDACGEQEACGVGCGRPGLLLVAPPDCEPTSSRGCPDPAAPLPGCTSTEQQGRTFATNDWVRSLAINMLMTDARKDNTLCGTRPGWLNGHWSESYQQGVRVGSKLRYIGKQTSTRNMVLAVKAEIMTTLQKLVDYGVATAVEVDVEYAGGGVLRANATVSVIDGQTANVAISGAMSQNRLIWS